jgi:uncharacterized protein involved in cysteine biosynthesis
MITITILIVLWFIYSVYKIKQTNGGSWKKFDPFIVPDFASFLGFAIGVIYGLTMLIIGAAFGIIP